MVILEITVILVILVILTKISGMWKIQNFCMDPWNIGNNGNLCNFKKSDTNLVNYGILVILVTFGKN